MIKSVICSLLLLLVNFSSTAQYTPVRQTLSENGFGDVLIPLWLIFLVVTVLLLWFVRQMWIAFESEVKLMNQA
ncbi:hypothetical protein DYBT9275_03563 [Dyadobacter sp. CECT 9275]|uniref:CcmD family protein n=1 Tax=Dyadobacter helix TaxID=2822344 RepID=A0A916N5I9_9BACT|nr:hypothetical protein [Dyadobacter sp. CECT 9275]CAG5005327.1 hypothetical protein DYBT9275_03563 [Dyadobacter sp. CECT 9275]